MFSIKKAECQTIDLNVAIDVNALPPNSCKYNPLTESVLSKDSLYTYMWLEDSVSTYYIIPTRSFLGL